MSAFIHSRLDDYGLTPAQFRVYCHICRRSNGAEHPAWASVDTMASVCKLHARTVRRALKDLVKLGFLLAENRPGRTTHYIPSEAWCTSTQPEAVNVNTTSGSDMQEGAPKMSQTTPANAIQAKVFPPRNPKEEVHTASPGFLPENVNEAHKIGEQLNVPGKFAAMIYWQAKGRGWKDGASQKITSFADYLQHRWGTRNEQHPPRTGKQSTYVEFRRLELAIKETDLRLKELENDPCNDSRANFEERCQLRRSRAELGVRARALCKDTTRLPKSQTP